MPTRQQIEALYAEVVRELKPGTRAAYGKDLKDFTETYCHLTDPTAAVHRLLSMPIDGKDGANAYIRKYRDLMDVRRGLSSSAINRRLSSLRKICQAAKRRNLIEWEVDVGNVKDEPENDPDALEVDETSRILAHAAKDDSPRGRRAYAILRLMVDLGLRRGGVAAIDFDDLRLPASKLRVRLKGRQKKRWKDVPSATITALLRWIDVHPLRGRRVGPLFVNLVPGRHGRISGSAIWEIVSQVSKAAGRPTHPHAFRRAAITNAIVNSAEVGETLDSVMQFSDHSDLRMVIRYRNRSKKAQKKFADSNAKTFGDPFANSKT